MYKWYMYYKGNGYGYFKRFSSGISNAFNFVDFVGRGKATACHYQACRRAFRREDEMDGWNALPIFASSWKTGIDQIRDENIRDGRKRKYYYLKQARQGRKKLSKPVGRTRMHVLKVWEDKPCFSRTAVENWKMICDKKNRNGKRHRRIGIAICGRNGTIDTSGIKMKGIVFNCCTTNRRHHANGIQNLPKLNTAAIWKTRFFSGWLSGYSTAVISSCASFLSHSGVLLGHQFTGINLLNARI